MKTTYKYTCCILAAALWLLSACTASRPEFDITSRLIPVDAHWDRTPEPQMEAIVSKYKTSVISNATDIHVSGAQFARGFAIFGLGDDPIASCPIQSSTKNSTNKITAISDRKKFPNPGALPIRHIIVDKTPTIEPRRIGIMKYEM